MSAATQLILLLPPKAFTGMSSVVKQVVLLPREAVQMHQKQIGNSSGRGYKHILCCKGRMRVGPHLSSSLAAHAMLRANMQIRGAGSCLLVFHSTQWCLRHSDKRGVTFNERRACQSVERP